MFKKYLIEINKWIASHIFKKKYMRIGKCKQCGKCCESIYVRHATHIIKEEEEFERLKNLHFFYSWLKVVDKNETGLVFECTKLDKINRKCTEHKNRATLCRQYPVEEIFEMGGYISEECGYKFIPIKSFNKVLKQVQKQNKS